MNNCVPNLLIVLVAVASLIGQTVDAGQTPIEGMDIHDCAEGADEDLKSTTPEPKPATS